MNQNKDMEEHLERKFNEREAQQKEEIERKLKEQEKELERKLKERDAQHKEEIRIQISDRMQNEFQKEIENNFTYKWFHYLTNAFTFSVGFFGGHLYGYNQGMTAGTNIRQIN